MNKKKYINAKIEIIKVEMEDVVLSSGFNGEEDVFSITDDIDN